MRRIFSHHLGEIMTCDGLFLSSKEKLTHGTRRWSRSRLPDSLSHTRTAAIPFPYISTNTPVLTLTLYSTDALAVCNKSGAHMSSL